jgi:hypothetical protein
MPTVIRQPAHPPPTAVCIAAQYPTIVSFIQLEGIAAFIFAYLVVYGT